MTQHGKRYRQSRGDIDREQMYTPVEAVRLLKEQPAAKFDETIEVHLNLGLNVRHAEEQLRGTMMLPHGTGREQRVAVFAEGDKAREAEEAGADVVGSADLAKRIEEGFTDFDVAIATPDQMGTVGRLGRVLGPRGLMPNPKTGTVTFEVAKAVKDAKAGKLEYRTDRGANVHIPIGKRSFDERALVENYAALIDEIVRAKPAVAKGRYIKKITLASTMGPGIHVDPTRTRPPARMRCWRSSRARRRSRSSKPMATWSPWPRHSPIQHARRRSSRSAAASCPASRSLHRAWRSSRSCRRSMCCVARCSARS